MNDEHKDGCMVDLWNGDNIDANRFILDVCECNWYDKSMDMTAEIICRGCGNIIDLDRCNFCPYCGRDLEEAKRRVYKRHDFCY